MAIGCIVMFSGGLDSVIAAHLLKNQGLDVLALHFVLPFDARLGKTHQVVRDRAECIGVPLRIEEQGVEFLDVMKHPVYGFGKNANPCMDCRIHRIKLTHKIMTEVGASFIATGEVVGQRPMSQRLDAMNIITRE